jgi:superfamily II DNA/RNA helicase
VIVFANMKTTVAKITEYCRKEGLAADSISGDRSQVGEHSLNIQSTFSGHSVNI